MPREGIQRKRAHGPRKLTELEGQRKFELRMEGEEWWDQSSGLKRGTENSRCKISPARESTVH